jgi:hypothetical protein
MALLEQMPIESPIFTLDAGRIPNRWFGTRSREGGLPANDPSELTGDEGSGETLTMGHSTAPRCSGSSRGPRSAGDLGTRAGGERSAGG